MPSPKYPLIPLLEHRARKVDEATAELGAAMRARASAEDARARADAARRDEERRTAQVEAEEAERLVRGELRAVDLAHARSWRIGAEARIDALARQTDAAERKAATAREHEVGARTELAQKMADRDVVAKDEARFRSNANKRALLAEEEAAEEAYQAKERP